jgi:hypothetical protein
MTRISAAPCKPGTARENARSIVIRCACSASALTIAPLEEK